GEGETDAVGHQLHHVRFREVLQAALVAADWKNPKPRPNYGRGIALSGRHISGGDTGLFLTAEADGSFTILSPPIGQGSGTHTIFRALVPDDMRAPVGQGHVVICSTHGTPRERRGRA